MTIDHLYTIEFNYKAIKFKFLIEVILCKI